MSAITAKPLVSPNARYAGVHTFVGDMTTIQVPPWVNDLSSFRQWIHSDEVPEKGARICFLDGEVWVDMSKEQAFSHNQVKGEYCIVLGTLCKRRPRGRYFSDGMLLTNAAANLSCGPDGIFISDDSFDAGKVRLVEGKRGGYVELEGTPDMVLEVLSDGSIRKDLESLLDLYWRAGIAEYWLVDAREDKLDFTIYRWTREGYVAVRKKAGWLASRVFEKSFRLVRTTDRLGHPQFTLKHR